MTIEKIKGSIRNVPDFPKPGIQFKDISTLLNDHIIFNEVIEIFYDTFKNKKIDAIIGIESRGFIFAAPLALKLQSQLILARKPGKLPCETIQEKYELEYGADAIEIQKASIKFGDRILVVDDLLATGGTAKTTGNLVKKLKGSIVSYAFVIELVDLKGSKLLGEKSVFSIVRY